jgi:hypothetical protein
LYDDIVTMLKPRTVEEEEMPVARDWLCNHDSTATVSTQEQRNHWRRCSMLGLCRGYTTTRSNSSFGRWEEVASQQGLELLSTRS